MAARRSSARGPTPTRPISWAGRCRRQRHNDETQVTDPGVTSAFEHVLLLLSFVYALALTHLLSRIGSLLLARARVTFSGLLALDMANAILLVFANWLSLWDIRGLREWD